MPAAAAGTRDDDEEMRKPRHAPQVLADSRLFSRRELCFVGSGNRGFSVGVISQFTDFILRGDPTSQTGA